MPILIVICLLTSQLFAGSKVAVVKIIRGDVTQLAEGRSSPLKTNDWVEDGAIIRTAEKSFAKLVFIDKSQMNVGPSSEMKIEKFSDKDAGVIDLVKGKIRSQVTKDYLQMDKDKSKMFVKTPNAVMGIRGTDFMISTNGKNTSAVLFEGEVVFNRLDARGVTNSDSLEAMVDRGVRLHPGEFSVMDAARSQPTEPSLMNVQQRESLEKNETFDSRSPGSSAEAAKKSVVPEGLSGKTVSNAPDALKEQIAQVVPPSEQASVKSVSADGYVAGDKVKPTAGSFLHIDSGTIIPPSADSVLDPNTNTYIPSAGNGSVGEDGNYVPPANVEITAEGKVMVAVVDANGAVKVQEVERPAPVMSSNSVSLGQVSQVIAQNPALLNPSRPIRNDILNSTFAPSGLNDVSNQQRNISGGINPTQAVQQRSHVPTRFIVRPVNP